MRWCAGAGRAGVRGFTLELLTPNFFTKRLLQTEIFFTTNGNFASPLTDEKCPPSTRSVWITRGSSNFFRVFAETWGFCLMKETQDEDVNACWRQNSDDVRQRQNTWCKTQDTTCGTLICDLFKQFYFDWILFYWLNLTSCDAGRQIHFFSWLQPHVVDSAGGQIER